LIRHLRAAGHTVGVVLIDPSSPFTGGALLGDRVRMTESNTDPGVFIRSMGSRGHLGGLSLATQDAVTLMDAFGFDFILIETVGIGQAETEIIKTADLTVVVAVPGLGDEIQIIKAGIMEIADIFVVNKADRDGAEKVVMEINMMLDMAPYAGSGGRPQPLGWGREPDRPQAGGGRVGRGGGGVQVAWGAGLAGPMQGARRLVPCMAVCDGGAHVASPGDLPRPPVLRTTANRDQGVAEMMLAIVDRWQLLEASGVLRFRRENRLWQAVSEGIRYQLFEQLTPHLDEESRHSILSRIRGGESSPFDEAQRILSDYRK